MLRIFDAEMTALDPEDEGRVYFIRTSNTLNRCYVMRPEHITDEDFERECRTAINYKYRAGAKFESVERADWLFD